MAGPYLFDRVKETSTTTGTGTLDLLGAVTNFVSFVSTVGTGNTAYYAIVHQSANEWEVGIGTVTDASPDTLSRTTVLASSNAGALVSFSAGTKDVFCNLPAAYFPSPVTPGSVLFGDSAGKVGQDNTNLFWDDTNNFMGLGMSTPAQRLHIEGGHIRFNHVAAPAACSAALAGTGAGNVDNGNHCYKVTFVTASGETALSTGVVVTVTDKTTNGQVALTSIPTGTTGVVTSRKIYRSKAGGAIFYLLTTLADNTTTVYTDNTADASLGATPPVQPTTAGKLMGGATSAITVSASNTFTAPIYDRAGYVKNVKGYGVQGGLQIKADGAMTAASAVLTSSGFAAGDEGKFCAVSWAGPNQIANPTTAATVSATGGGSTGGFLTAGDYRVQYTWVSLYGETTVGTSESSLFTLAAGNIPRVTIPSLPANALFAKIYLTPVGGTTNTELLAATGITATTADLTGPNRVEENEPPAANTTAEPLITVIKTFTNSTTVTLADAASTTTSSADVVYGWDDTAAFQSAIDNSNGLIVVPSGNYMVSQLSMKASRAIVGSHAASIIVQKPGFSGHMFIMDTDDSDDIAISDLKLSGMQTLNGNVNHCIYFNAATATGDAGHEVTNNEIQYFQGSAIYLGANMREVRLVDNFCLYNHGPGIYMASGATDNIISNNTTGHSGTYGFHIVGVSNRFTDNKAFWAGRRDSSLGHGFLVEGANNEFTGCTSQDAFNAGWYLKNCVRLALSNCLSDNTSGYAFVIDNIDDSSIHGQLQSYPRSQSSGVLSILNAPLRNVVRLTFDSAAIATGGVYVSGTATDNDIHIGPDGGYQAPAFPGTRTWTVDTGTEILTTNTAHGLSEGDPIYVSNSGGALPTSSPQIAINTLYYALSPSGSTLQLAATPGGAAITFSGGGGTGTHSMQLPLKPNPYDGNFITMTMTGDMPIALPTQKHQGQRMSFQLTQDATGGRRIGFSSAYSIIEWLPKTTASTVSFIHFIYNGTSWLQYGGQTTATTNVHLTTDAAISTTQSDVTDTAGNILRFAIGPNESWSFEFNLQNGSSTAAGIAYALTVPSGATFMATMWGTSTGPTASTSSVMTVSGTLATAVNTVNAGTGVTNICGTVVNGTTGGFVALQADKVTNGTGTVFAKSYLTARRSNT